MFYLKKGKDLRMSCVRIFEDAFTAIRWPSCGSNVQYRYRVSSFIIEYRFSDVAAFSCGRDVFENAPCVDTGLLVDR